MSRPDIYTTPLVEQPVEAHLNTVLWRLGVAAGLIQPGSSPVRFDPDELLADLERRLSMARQTPTAIDTRPVEILGENGEIIGIFDPTQQF